MRTIIQHAVCGLASVIVTTGMVMASAPAVAAVPDDVARVAVRTADLDLASPAGRATAESRIRIAADRVCEGFGDPLAAATCRDAAHAAGMGSLDARVATLGGAATIAAR